MKKIRYFRPKAFRFMLPMQYRCSEKFSHFSSALGFFCVVSKYSINSRIGNGSTGPYVASKSNKAHRGGYLKPVKSTLPILNQTVPTGACDGDVKSKGIEGVPVLNSKLSGRNFDIKNLMRKVHAHHNYNELQAKGT